jgi:hypothetical protein
MKTPVLLSCFNRPDKISQVIQPVRQAKPPVLFISVDGPRVGHEGESAKCLETQRIVEAAIDWPCEVHRIYRSENLGCRRAVSLAISQAFERVEELIIIEDDCLLDSSFFELCETLLPRHRNDPMLSSISAANFQAGQLRGKGDYYLSKYQHCWGWATWRRAWQNYEDDIGKLHDAVHGSLVKTLHSSEDERSYWQLAYQRCVDGEVDSWAYRWQFGCWLQGARNLIPNRNLVTNIGFDGEATHTTEGAPAMRTVEWLSSFKAPDALVVDAEADAFTFNEVYCPLLSHARLQVSLHRIRLLKAELKSNRDQLVATEQELKKLKCKPRWHHLLGL